MAMEVHVFFRGKVPSVAALARALKELGFPFSIPAAKGSLAQRGGFLPMKLRREETGVEIDLYDHAAVTEFSTYGVDQSYRHMASFRWSGSMEEAAAGLCSAAALAKLTDGVVFDEAEGKLLSASEAIAAARQFLETLPKPDPRLPGTRPADIKRYLKPLLEMRSDLALIGRMLVIQPVRHVLRGALLDRTSDRHVLQLYRVAKPLYAGAAGIHGESVNYFDVRTPEFEAMLFDFLIGDVFSRVAKVDSLDAYRTLIEAKPHWPETLFAPVLLSKGISEANNFLARFEQEETVAPWVKANRTLLQCGPDVAFDHFRELESATVKEMRVDHIWERTPFPAELPEAVRAVTAEPDFVMDPWVNLPATWREDLSNEPGTLRFGLSWWRRADCIFLLMPMAYEEAASRHSRYESYVLATRLESGAPLLLRSGPSIGVSARIDEDGQLHPPTSFEISITAYGLSGLRIQADFRNWFRDPAELALTQVDIVNADTWQHRWYSYIDVREHKKKVHDDRSGQTKHTLTQMDESELSKYTLPIPSFGDFMPLWNKITLYLATEGFGEFS